ncbi:MAG: corrinoid protein [Candidatus Bathyarchaeia archaeon]
MVDCRDAIVNLEVGKIQDIVQEALGAGRPPMEILKELQEGMQEVGSRFQRGEYFFSELIMAGETMKEALKVLKPLLGSGRADAAGKIVIGTIQGDLHDIGKDIVSTLLFSAGFEVHDLGIDVPPSRFVEEAEEAGASIIGVSALLSVTVPTVSKVAEVLKEKGLRSKVKIIAGGAAMRPEYAEKLGIDAAVNDAVEGVEIIKGWVGAK